MEQGRGEPPKITLKTRLTQLFQGLKEGVDFHDKKIPPEQINSSCVAQTILDHLGIRAKERLGWGKRWENDFSIVPVLEYLGYGAWFTGTDYLTKFPEAYQATLTALYALVRDGALEKFDLGEKDANQESIHYQVIDEERLREIASQKETAQT